MSQTSVIVWVLSMAAIVAGFAVIGVFFLRRHRRLFRELSALRYALTEARIRLRKETRLLEIRQRQRQGGAAAIEPRFTGQDGEDIFIYDFFRDHPPGFFVEAGAFDGVTHSNTYLLEGLGWKGLLVEPQPRLAAEARANRPGSRVVQAALGNREASGTIPFTCAGELSFVGTSAERIERCRKEGLEVEEVKVPLTPLNRLLEGMTERVDFLSLDVEGFEREVLDGFDIARYRPSLIVMEASRGASSEWLRGHLRQHGYVAMAATPANLFFVHQAETTRFRGIPMQDEAWSDPDATGES